MVKQSLITTKSFCHHLGDSALWQFGAILHEAKQHAVTLQKAELTDTLTLCPYAVVAELEQCGGYSYDCDYAKTGGLFCDDAPWSKTSCRPGYKCERYSSWWHSCQLVVPMTTIAEGQQCGGNGGGCGAGLGKACENKAWTIAICQAGTACQRQTDADWRCRRTTAVVTTPSTSGTTGGPIVFLIGDTARAWCKPYTKEPFHNPTLVNNSGLLA